MSDGTLPQYRSISWAAVLAFGLAIVSVLSLFNPLCVVIAVAAAGLSLIALRQISAKPEIFSGHRLALTALFVSVFFMIFAPTRVAMRSRLLQQRGQQLAEAFLSLLKEGKTYDAHQLSNLKHPSLSQGPDFDADPNKLTDEDLRGFEETHVIQAIKRIQPKFDYHLDGIEPSRTYSEMEIFVFRYQLVPDSSTGKRPFLVWITVARQRDRKSGAITWKIVDVQENYKGNEH
jgi:hypothetical protein